MIMGNNFFLNDKNITNSIIAGQSIGEPGPDGDWPSSAKADAITHTIILNSMELFDPSIIFGYLLKSSFGGEGWIVSVDDLEDII